MLLKLFLKNGGRNGGKRTLQTFKGTQIVLKNGAGIGAGMGTWNGGMETLEII